MFSKRFIEPELLDHAPAEEARENLADLVKINSRFGGHSVIRRTLARAIQPNEQFTLLDIGAASGDTARVIQQAYPGARITSLDYNLTNSALAPFPKLIADAFALPFAKGSFDYVLCSLFLHHFEDAKVVELLRAFYGVARKALLVCDLERHVLPYLFLPATKPFFSWKRITLHDGPISVRAAFRLDELKSLASQAGLANAEVQAYRPAFRLSLVARKR